MGYENVKFPEGSTFLVTGGAGFIGSNLCEAILKQGYKVRCLDDLSTGKQENVDLLIDNPNYTFIKGDIKDLDTCMKACDGVDYVLNQAAWGSVPRSIEMPLFYCANNITGTLNMMEAARQNGVKKFVYASSSSVYGDEPNLPKKEGREGNLLSPYAVSKRADEEWAKQYTKHYGLDTYGLRYFNVFGRRQDPNGAYAAVIPLFVKKFMAHEAPNINGDGEYSRDFTYIDNVIQMNMLALTTENPDAVNQIYNTAFGERTTLNQLVQYLKEYLSDFDPEIAKIEPTHGPNRAGDIPHSLACVDKAKKLLGYDPKYSMKDGLKEAVKWYWENI